MHQRLLWLICVAMISGVAIRNVTASDLTVNGDGGAVKAGNVIYCTQRVYDRLVQEFGK
jgi:hypothetical protein